VTKPAWGAAAKHEAKCLKRKVDADREPFDKRDKRCPSHGALKKLSAERVLPEGVGSPLVARTGRKA